MAACFAPLGNIPAPGTCTNPAPGSTDPSSTLMCTSNNVSAVLSSSGSGLPNQQTTQNSKPTPIQNMCNAIEQQNAGNAGGYAAGGTVTPTTTTPSTDNPTATPTTPTCAVTTAGVPTATPAANSAIQTIEAQNATNPTLTKCETISPTMIKCQPGDTMCPNAVNVGTPKVTPTTVGGTAVACTVQAPAAATYTASQTCTNNPAFNIQGATATACPNAIVSNQIQQLTAGLNTCAPPAWAQSALNAANANMAARGLGTSSIAAGNEVSAIESAVLPVAQANAQYFANLQTQNLSNEQQAVIANQAATVQAMLSNTAAVNAAAQFNATSENQVSQFFANLNSQIQLSNAAQINAMNQFNSGQLNSVAEYNATLQNNVDQFNAQNQLAIDQSNVTWQRNINTLNTAAINSAQQTNAQNEFNLSQTAQNNLWNQWQDEASWANTDSQNALTRAQNMAIAAMGVSAAYNLQTQQGQEQLTALLGAFGLNALGPSISKGITSLTGGNSSGNTTSCGVNNVFCPITNPVTTEGGQTINSCGLCLLGSI